MGYLDQVVKFIEQNTAGIRLGNDGDGYVDPFTGRFHDEVLDVKKS